MFHHGHFKNNNDLYHVYWINTLYIYIGEEMASGIPTQKYICIILHLFTPHFYQHSDGIKTSVE